MWKGEETDRNDSSPISSRALPGASHIHSGREEVIPYNLAPTKTCQGRKPGYSIIFRVWQRAFPFFQTKKTTDPGFSLKEKEKA